MRALAVVACSLVASCSYSVSFKDCEVACGAQNACPAELTCNGQGRCRVAGAIGSCPAFLDAGIDAASDARGDAAGDAGGHAGVPGIYVTSFFGPFAVVVYPLGASGSAAPGRTITGSNTMLDTPIGIAIDHAGEIVVANLGGPVTVYPGNADGNFPPSRVLALPSVGAFSVAVGADDSIFAAGPNNGVEQVFHFPPGATTSDRSFNAAGTNDPYIAIDDNGNVVVSAGQDVGIYTADATGTATPLDSFTRTPTGNSAAVATAGSAVTVTEDTGQIQVYDAPTGGEDSLVAPSQIVHAAGQMSLAADLSTGSVVFYVAEVQAPTVFVVQTTGSGTVLAAAGVTSIVGASSFEPAGIAVVP